MTMRSCLNIIFTIVVILSSCDWRKKEALANIPGSESDLSKHHAFSSRNVHISFNDCEMQEEQCAYFNVNYLYTYDPLRQKISDHLSAMQQSTIRSFLAFIGEKHIDLNTVGRQFIKEFSDFKTEFPNSAQAWIIESDCMETHQNDSVYTFKISTMAYTGGAHPNQTTRLVNYSKRDHHEISLAELFKDPTQLQQTMTEILKSNYDLDPDQCLSDGGFFIEGKVVPLNGNFGFTENGLLFHYDPYEIGPYSLGPVEIEVPTAKMKWTL